jgi:glycosyltransferase involved in cell wall biosynthesis
MTPGRSTLGFAGLVRAARTVAEQRVIRFDRGRKRRAAMLYITAPFTNFKLDHIHSNRREAREIAAILTALGYGVDVYQYCRAIPVKTSGYELIFGFGDAYERTFQSSYAGRRIYYSTAAAPAVQDYAEADRIRAVQRETGVALKLRRMANRTWPASHCLSDLIVTSGNQWTANTLSAFGPPVVRVPVTYIEPVASDRSRRLQSHVLWFGSSGAIHKGLDLAIGAIEQLRGAGHLHICGPTEREEDFWTAYETRIRDNPNITYHGYVDVRSDEFRRVLETATFVLAPSCSEGGGSACLTCVAAGLVPIAADSSSIDLEDFGIRIPELTRGSVAAAIRSGLELSEAEVSRRSLRGVEHVASHHSIDAFRKAMREALSWTPDHGR